MDGGFNVQLRKFSYFMTVFGFLFRVSENYNIIQIFLLLVLWRNSIDFSGTVRAYGELETETNEYELKQLDITKTRNQDLKEKRIEEEYK